MLMVKLGEMARLPKPGGDSGNWGEILNDYLLQAHNNDGTLKSGVVSKSDVGLGNVDNTADTSKPISTAQQSALDSKVNSSQVGSADGIAPLDDLSYVPEVNLPNIDAWRKDYFDRLTALAPVDDMPTVTYAQQTASTIVGGADLIRIKRTGDGSNANGGDIAGDTHFRIDGTTSLDVVTANTAYVTAPLLPGGTAQAAPYMPRIETITDATNSVVEIKVRPASTSLGYRLWVDGKPVSLSTDVLSGLSAGSSHVVKFTFPRARARRILISNVNRWGIDGLYVPTGQALTRPTSPIRLRVATLGDSFLGGAGSIPTGSGRGDTWGTMMATFLGADSYWQFGIGGTGWTTVNPYSERVSALVACAPDEVYILGSRNDDNIDVSAEVASVLTSLASISKVYVVGPTESDYPVLTASIKSATEAAGRTFIDPASRHWVNLDPTKYRYSDGIHPSWAGQKRIACGIYEARQKAQAI